MCTKPSRSAPTSMNAPKSSTFRTFPWSRCPLLSALMGFDTFRFHGGGAQPPSGASSSDIVISAPRSRSLDAVANVDVRAGWRSVALLFWARTAHPGEHESNPARQGLSALPTHGGTERASTAHARIVPGTRDHCCGCRWGEGAKRVGASLLNAHAQAMSHSAALAPHGVAHAASARARPEDKRAGGGRWVAHRQKPGHGQHHPPPHLQGLACATLSL